MKFKHPLARSAKVWPAYLQDEMKQDVLVVLTTLELDSESKKFKAELHERLTTAVRAYLAENRGKATGFVLMNKPKF